MESRPTRSGKTAATIPGEAALSARLVADQPGHSGPSMAQDVYMGDPAAGSQAALALEAVRSHRPSGRLDVLSELLVRLPLGTRCPTDRPETGPRGEPLRIRLRLGRFPCTSRSGPIVLDHGPLGRGGLVEEGIGCEDQEQKTEGAEQKPEGSASALGAAPFPKKRPDGPKGRGTCECNYPHSVHSVAWPVRFRGFRESDRTPPQVEAHLSRPDAYPRSPRPPDNQPALGQRSVGQGSSCSVAEQGVCDLDAPGDDRTVRSQGDGVPALM